MSDEVEHSAVEQRSKVDREPVADGSAVRDRGGGRGGGRRVLVAGTPSQRVVDRGAGCHIRHVERTSEGVDGGTSRLVGETEQSEDSVRDSRAYCRHHTIRLRSFNKLVRPEWPTRQAPAATSFRRQVNKLRKTN